MPFSQTYRCSNGHEFQYLHMGSRESCPEFVPCEGVIIVEESDGTTLSPQYDHLACSALAEKTIGAPLPQTIVKGNHDYAQREKARLTKRSNDHFHHGGGKEEAMDRIKMQRKREGG